MQTQAPFGAKSTPAHLRLNERKQNTPRPGNNFYWDEVKPSAGTRARSRGERPAAPSPAFLLLSAGRGAPADGKAPRAQSPRAAARNEAPRPPPARRQQAAARHRPAPGGIHLTAPAPRPPPRLASPQGAAAAGKAARLEVGTLDAHSLPAAVAEEGEGEDEVLPLTPPTGPRRRRCPRRAPVMFI